MFDPSIKNNPAAATQQKLVNATMRTRIGDGTFTYTELLSAEEPMRTMGLMFLDGIVLNGSFPVGGGEIENWGGERIRLVAIETATENGTVIKPIKVGVMQDVPRPGTFVVERKKVMKSFGDIADMTDNGPNERLARLVLVQRGFPVLTNRGNSRDGDVVEWRWLEREAAKGDMAAPGIVELYEKLLPRVQAFDEAQAKATEEKQAKRKYTKTAPAPAGSGV